MNTATVLSRQEWEAENAFDVHPSRTHDEAEAAADAEPPEEAAAAAADAEPPQDEADADADDDELPQPISSRLISKVWQSLRRERCSMQWPIAMPMFVTLTHTRL